MSEANQKKSILILSDDSALATSLSLFLENEFNVDTSGYTHGLDMLMPGGSDLYIFDMSMPESKHVKAIKQLRKEIPRAAVIAMYAYHDKSKKLDNELRSQSCAIMYKPVNILDLLGKIRYLLT